MRLNDVFDYLWKHDLSVDIDKVGDKYRVLIEWGDWKHDHAFCDYLMEQIGYKCIEEEVTEQDGSDCYSAIHTYEPIKK